MRIRDWSSDVCSSDLTAPVCARAQVPASHVAGFVSLSEHHLHVNDELHGSVALDDQASRAVTATGADHDLSERGAHSERLTSLHCTPEIGRASCRERVCQYV